MDTRSFESSPSPSLCQSDRKELVWCVLAWLLVAILVSVVSYEDGKKRHSVTDAYRTGADKWIQGERLYRDALISGHAVLYQPQSYIVFIPFSEMPPFVGDLCWRLAIMFVWMLATFRLAELFGRVVPGRVYWCFSLIVIVLSLAAARLGQSTLPLTAVMLLTAIDLSKQRWTGASFWLFLGLCLKPHIAPMFLLAFVLFRPMRLRLLAVFLVFLLFPFLCQRTDYVLESYRDYPKLLNKAVEVGKSGEFPSASLHRLIGFLGLPFPEPFWKAMQLVLAVVVLGLCWRLSKESDSYLFIISFFSLPAIYLLLMNTRTENNAYMMLAPAIASCFLIELRLYRNRLAIGFLILLIIGLVGHYELGKFIVGKENVPVICPFLTLLWLVYVFARFKELSAPLLPRVSTCE